jgi:hypothetical protein
MQRGEDDADALNELHAAITLWLVGHDLLPPVLALTASGPPSLPRQ